MSDPADDSTERARLDRWAASTDHASLLAAAAADSSLRDAALLALLGAGRRYPFAVLAPLCGEPGTDALAELLGPPFDAPARAWILELFELARPENHRAPLAPGVDELLIEAFRGRALAELGEAEAALARVAAARVADYDEDLDPDDPDPGYDECWRERLYLACLGLPTGLLRADVGQVER